MKKSMLILICVMLCMFAFTAGVSAEMTFPELFSVNAESGTGIFSDLISKNSDDISLQSENTLAVTDVIYGVRVDGETLETTVKPTKLETSVTVTKGSNTVTPENIYLVEITEDQSLFSLNLILNQMIDFMGNINRDPKSGGTDFKYMGANNLNEILVDDSTTFTGFEKEAGCTYYFATSLDSSQQFNNKLGIIICVKPNSGSQEPENAMAVTGVTYNGGQEATVTKLDNSVTVNVPKPNPWTPAYTIAPNEVYLVEINEALNAADIVIETKEAMQLCGTFGGGFKKDSLATEYIITSEDRDANYLILGETGVTVTGYEAADGCTYYFVTSGYYDEENWEVKFDNKLGIIICVNPNGGSQEPVNNVPTLADGVSAEVTAEIEAGSAYTVDLSTIFTDADNDDLTYTVAVNGADAEVISKDYSKTFDALGDYKLVFTASDGEASVTHTVTLTVYDLNPVDITTQEDLADFMQNAKKGQVGTLKNDLVLSDWKSYDETWGDALITFNGILDGNGHTITIDSDCHNLCRVNNGTIKNLTLAGELEDSHMSMGSFCNSNKGTITNCKNAIDVSTMNRPNGRGGICGVNENSGIISNCYNTGDITGNNAGGIAWENLGTIQNCINTGLIRAEYSVGGIVYKNHYGDVENCFNFGLIQHLEGWDKNYGSYIEKELGPIVGDNAKDSFNAGNGGVLTIESEGTVENCFYIDAYVQYKDDEETLTAELSGLYQTEKIVEYGWDGSPVHALCGWQIHPSQTVFSEDTDYYAYYDMTNDHFIVAVKDPSATSNLIDAKNPGTEYVEGTSAGGEKKNFYLVKVPENASTVEFKNTEAVVNYSLGYTNEYLQANLLLDHSGVSFGAHCSEKFMGTSISSATSSVVLIAAKAICGNDAETTSYIEKMLGGVKRDNVPTEPEEMITVTFRLVGATLSESGEYDLSKNPPVKDSEYVTWIATKSFEVAKNTTAGELLSIAIQEANLRADGIENNYVARIYAPDMFGDYGLAEFTNGERSGWMYSVNGIHPDTGVNGYFLKDGDEMVFHYVNDYLYEVSDWFGGSLGDASTLDPWLKILDVNPGENNDAVIADAVEALINAIGEVTIESKDAIESARAAYDALTDDQKSLVDNYAVLTAAEAKYAELTKPAEPVELPFTDIPDAWYQDAIRFVYENGIMNGMTETTFEPGTTLSRAMFITMLYRMDGETAVSGDLAYTDVKADFWYTDAIIWGTEAGIINGYGDGIFRPDGLVTRQEMAKMMYCFAEYKGMDVTASASFENFNDGDLVAEWAAPYLGWAVAEELIKGDTNGNLNPAGNATRAEAATVIMRLDALF